MKYYRPKIQTLEEIDHIVCDRCNKVIWRENWLEMQETLQISHICGYGSIFGDGTEINLDFCQDCAYRILAPYLKSSD